jgi:hypothetical protein
LVDRGHEPHTTVPTGRFTSWRCFRYGSATMTLWDRDTVLSRLLVLRPQPL